MYIACCNQDTGKSSLNSPFHCSTFKCFIVFGCILTLSEQNYFQPQGIDTLLRGCIGDFLRTLQDPDLNVRRVALVTFNSAAHNKPSLIRDLLDSVLPHLYNETKIRVSKVDCIMAVVTACPFQWLVRSFRREMTFNKPIDRTKLTVWTACTNINYLQAITWLSICNFLVWSPTERVDPGSGNGSFQTHTRWWSRH